MKIWKKLFQRKESKINEGVGVYGKEREVESLSDESTGEEVEGLNWSEDMMCASGVELSSMVSSRRSSIFSRRLSQGQLDSCPMTALKKFSSDAELAAKAGRESPKWAKRIYSTS